MTAKRPLIIETRKKFIDKYGSGPYVGIVKNNVDPTYMSRLAVYIPEMGGDPRDESSWVTCHYVTPFYGAVPKPNEPLMPGTKSVWTDTQQSYGMWFAPPDLETQVLVIFANKRVDNAFWIGCIPEAFINTMIPGIASRYAVNDDNTDSNPIAEVNKNIPAILTDTESNWQDTGTVPPHDEMIKILKNQGLDEDRARGVSSSTVRRETPSRVFGISTPGIPVNYDDEGWPSYRLPGHQFVMDDGDELGRNQLIRLRTGAGSQIVMNDSVGIIYIINKDGTSWIEMTEEGKIDIFSQDSISINTDKDFNVNASGNINMNAFKNVQVRSNAESKYEAGGNLHVLSAKSTYHTGTQEVHLTSGGSTYLAQGRDFNLVASRNGFIYAVNSLNQVGGTQLNLKSTTVSLKGTAINNTAPAINLEGDVFSGPIKTPDIDSGGPTASATEASIAAAAVNAKPIERPYSHQDAIDGLSIPVHNPRIPLVEPWIGHEARIEGVDLPPGAGAGSGAPGTGGGGGTVPENRKRYGKVGPFQSFDIPTDLQSLIDAMAPLNWPALREGIAYFESRGNYGVVNKQGYMGRYQFGSNELATYKVMTEAAVAKYKENPSYYKNNLNPIINNDAFWATPPGSLKGFLNDTILQDKVMVKYTYDHFTQLKARGVLTANSTAKDIAGALMGAHLGGVGGVTSYFKSGTNSSDANGTSISRYVQLGRSTQR